MHRTRSRLPSRLTILLVGVILSLFVAAGPALAQQVVITDDGIEPATLEVEAGSTVTFVNQGTDVVRLADDAGRWDSGELAPGDTFSVSFDEPGEATYASEDGSRSGTVVVIAGDTPVETMPDTGAPILLLAGVAVGVLAAGVLLLRRS